jgi:hypothetical protein
MTDERRERATDEVEGAREAQLTNEERLRALAGDRKPKTRGKRKGAQGDAQHRPGDVVDAVRERRGKDKSVPSS